MTKKLAPQEKVNRKPTSRACAFCHQKHLQCDQGRPCKNCIKRGIQDTCHNVERKRAKYLADAPPSTQTPGKETAKRSRAPSKSSVSQTTPTSSNIAPVSIAPFGTPDHISTSSNSIPHSSIFNSNNISGNNNNNNHHNNSTTSSLISPPPPNQHLQPHLPHAQAKNTPSSVSTDSPEVFSSLFANQEYAQLADLLDNNSAHSPSQSSVQNYNIEFQSSLQADNNTRPYISVSDNTNTLAHSITHTDISEQPTDYTSPLILRHLIKIPEDVYSTDLQPYNYPKAYHALLNHLKARFKKDQLIQIAETMAEYRPSFIAATRSLVEMDLLFAERSFQRSLLEYESMSSLSSSPTIMWRRTGEIVAVSTEFSSLTSHTKTELLSKRTFIIELMNDKSALDYFKLFSSVAFGDLNGVIITECTLLSPFGEEIRCASTWTVKRDVFDIPMLIVGQFLPILQVR